VQEEIAVKVFIMNNGYLGMVRQWQELFWDHRYSHVDMGEHPDFVKLAEAYGATGLRFTDKGSLVADIRAAIATPGRCRRRPRDAGREHLSDDLARRRRARHGGVIAMGEPGTKARSASKSSTPPSACAPGASTCCRSWSRTARVS